MREVEGLLSWLAVTDLENLERREAYTLVGKALEELENETSEQQDEDLLDEAFDSLQEIQQILLKGDLPTGKLVDFYQRFDPAFRSPLECSAGELDAELRELAEQLPERDWCTSSYLKVEHGIQSYLDGEDGPLQSALREMETIIEAAWEPYAQSSVVNSEVTSESVLGHKLLSEGLQSWLTALDMIRAALEEDVETDWQQVLDAAPEGNRLLIVVQKFSQRLQSQV